MAMELDKKTVLLTGASGGLGRAMAEALAERGARLVLSSRSPEELEALARALRGEGHGVIACDLSEADAPETLAAQAGAVDVLVANAGLGANGRIDKFEAQWIELVVRVNLEAPIRLARALVPAMRERGSGQMVFVSSLAGKAATSSNALYGATKAGLRGFALSLRQDLGRDGVGVSVICPGFIREAGMFSDSGRTPPMKLGTSTPREVGEAVVGAIEHNRPEVDVAPLRQRLLANFAGRHPHLIGRISRAAG
jgi:short-subunit dehydrogenase